MVRWGAYALLIFKERGSKEWIVLLRDEGEVEDVKGRLHKDKILIRDTWDLI